MPKAKRRGRVYKAMRRTGPASCGSCQARIVFVFMTATGKPVPVDPIPVDDGNVCARQVSPTRKEGYMISKDKPPNPSYTRFAAHFGTCADRPRTTPKPKPAPAPTLFDTPTQQGSTSA